MKKMITIGAIVSLLLNNYSFAQTTTKTVVTPRKTVTKTIRVVNKKPGKADIAQGKALISKSDCLSCHRLDVKLIGPAYIDVAKKYPASSANYELLSKKVIEGGSGNWGPVAMSPHPTLKPSDVKKMIEYILSLK
jgi:cytochrome c